MKNETVKYIESEVTTRRLDVVTGMNLFYIDSCNFIKYTVIEVCDQYFTVVSDCGYEETHEFIGLQIGWCF